MPKARFLAFTGAVTFIVFLWSLIHPHDYFTWFLEVAPASVGFVVLAATYPKFKFTNLVYGLIVIHMMILMVGGHYTYARVPLFDWVRNTFHQSRNNYDKVGHFAQGFVPAFIAREVLLRKTPLQRGGWLDYIVISICLAISATYELFEWIVAISSGASADDFLGTQGDPWDTQSDMAFALLGATVAVVLFSRLHDDFLEKERLLLNS